MVVIDEMKACEVAETLGMSAKNVAQVAIRARSAPREGCVRAHLGDPTLVLESPECAAALQQLPADTDGTRLVAEVDAHIVVCAPCAKWVAKLQDDSVKLRNTLLPILQPVSVSTLSKKLVLNVGVAVSEVAEAISSVAKWGLQQARTLLAFGTRATIGLAALVLISLTGCGGGLEASTYVMSGTSERTEIVGFFPGYKPLESERQCTLEQSVTLLNPIITVGEPVDVRIERSGYCGIEIFSWAIGSSEKCDESEAEARRKWSEPPSDVGSWAAGAFLRPFGSTREAPLHTGGIEEASGVIQLRMADWSSNGFIDYTSEVDFRCLIYRFEGDESDLAPLIGLHVLVGDVSEAYTLSFEYPYLAVDEEQLEPAVGIWELSVGVQGLLGTHFSWQLDNIEQVSDADGRGVEPWLRLEILS
jgi:hypothetical protein